MKNFSGIRILELLSLSTLFLFSSFFVGCKNDRSKLIEEIERHTHDDSIRKATEALITLKLEKKHSLSDTININTQKLKGLRDQIKKEEIELEVQKDKLIQIKQFQWFRSQSEREQQIRDQMGVIAAFEDNIQSLRNQILELEMKTENLKRELLSLQ